MKLLPLLLLLAGCTFSWGRDTPEPTVRLCLSQREITLRRGEVLRTVELQPCVPALGEFK